MSHGAFDTGNAGLMERCKERIETFCNVKEQFGVV